MGILQIFFLADGKGRTQEFQALFNKVAEKKVPTERLNDTNSS